MSDDGFGEKLRELGADRLAHSRRSLSDHLLGTGRILRGWGCDDAVCAAGAFHSVYGTNAFALSCQDRRDRDRVRDMLGARAERLVYLFSVGDRPQALLSALREARLIDRFTGASIDVTPAVVRDLLEVECANLIEQGAGHAFLAELIQHADAGGAAVIKPRIAEDIRRFLDHLTRFDFAPCSHQGNHMDVSTAVVSNDADAAQFDERGYLVLRNLLSRRFLDVALRYYLSYLKLNDYYKVDDGTRALDRYADALGEAFFPEIQPVIEHRIGKKLLPTYSFARIYTPESRLTKHVDRGSCEISATMTVGFKTRHGLWPIFLEHAGESVAVELDVGDALIYRGMDLPHWREPLESGFWCQLFFHFVDADGTLCGLRFDERSSLGPFLPPLRE
ncbi:DUF6817 domain-containing protein [Pseudomonas sp. CGJS7]|uniref:DUF6817 domain-containing protein n=1 Tax=Pseudomonas sp. CGJS7 TaxID=3109348 RepID=UPI003009EAD4